MNYNQEKPSQFIEWYTGAGRRYGIKGNRNRDTQQVSLHHHQRPVLTGYFVQPLC